MKKQKKNRVQPIVDHNRFRSGHNHGIVKVAKLPQQHLADEDLPTLQRLLSQTKLVFSENLSNEEVEALCSDFFKFDLSLHCSDDRENPEPTAAASLEEWLEDNTITLEEYKDDENINKKVLRLLLFLNKVGIKYEYDHESSTLDNVDLKQYVVRYRNLPGSLIIKLLSCSVDEITGNCWKLSDIIDNDEIARCPRAAFWRLLTNDGLTKLPTQSTPPDDDELFRWWNLHHKTIIAFPREYKTKYRTYSYKEGNELSIIDVPYWYTTDIDDLILPNSDISYTRQKEKDKPPTTPKKIEKSLLGVKKTKSKISWGTSGGKIKPESIIRLSRKSDKDQVFLISPTYYEKKIPLWLKSFMGQHKYARSLDDIIAIVSVNDAVIPVGILWLKKKSRNLIFELIPDVTITPEYQENLRIVETYKSTITGRKVTIDSDITDISKLGLPNMELYDVDKSVTNELIGYKTNWNYDHLYLHWVELVKSYGFRHSYPWILVDNLLSETRGYEPLNNKLKLLSFRVDPLNKRGELVEDPTANIPLRYTPI